MVRKTFIAAAALACLLMLAPSDGSAQVLGPCGAPSAGGEGKDAAPAAAAPAPAPQLLVKPVPLPGQRALDFELTAVVGDDIKRIKLSDFQGKWRILCFYPADFTFV